MAAERRVRVLLAVAPLAAPLVSRLLGEEFDVLTATSFAEAVKALDGCRVDVLVLGYHFDEMRPYRLLQYLQESRAAAVRIVMVRGLPFPSVALDEAETANTYQRLGVSAYLVLDKAAPADRFDETAAALRRTVREAQEAAP